MYGKIIFSDIDGTIIPLGSNQISDYNFEVIKRMNKSGNVKLVLITGRPLSALKNSFPLEELDIICSNGSLFFRDGKIAYIEKIENKELISYCKELSMSEDVACLFSSVEGSYLLNNSDVDIYKYGLGDVQGNNKLTFDTVIKDGILKISLIGEESVIEKVHKFIPFREWCELKGVQFNNQLDFLRTHSNCIDINYKNFDKGQAIVKYKEMFGYADAYTIAIGDGANDVPMLRESDEFIAVGNAIDDLKKEATKISRVTDEYSWGEVVRSYI